MKAHPTALVSPDARIGQDVEIGPFCVIEPGVVVGDGCVLERGVVLKRGTTLGPRNRIMESAVIGGLPQHVHMPERPGRVVIGQDNMIRESVTVHRAMTEDAATTVGDHNLLMVNVHVGHDCRVGSHTVITNNTMLGGHVLVEDRAFVSGAVAVHQYCRIGSLAMVGGQAHVVQDVPPFVNVDGLSSLVVGINQIGLRRAGFSTDTMRRLKEAYRVLYRSGLPWKEILQRLAVEFPDAPASHFHEFCAATTRGIISERRMPPGATIKLRRLSDEEPAVQTKAG